jgi:hypothetical protein
MNWSIWICGMLFATEQNWYFGWHWYPHSDAELICDGIALLIFALAFVKVTPRAPYAVEFETKNADGSSTRRRVENPATEPKADAA